MPEEKKEIKTCENCGKMIIDEDIKIFDDLPYCKDCLDVAIEIYNYKMNK